MSKLSKEQLLKAKEEIISGKSITTMAKELGIDRKKLKKDIITILTDSELSEFENKLNSNYRKNKISIRREKQKSKEEQYGRTLEKLIKMGIKKEYIEEIATLINNDQRNKMAKDTFVIKLLELLKFCEERNTGLSKEDKGYISHKDLLNMIKRDKKFMTNDVNRKLKPVCEILDKHEGLTRTDVNEIIKGHPHIFRNSIKKIDMLSAIGSNFLIKQDSKYTELFKYILTGNQHMLSINPEKLYKRLHYIMDIKNSTIMTVEDLRAISRYTYKDTDRGVDDSILNERYTFPIYDEKSPIEFRRVVKGNLRINKTEVVKE